MAKMGNGILNVSRILFVARVKSGGLSVTRPYKRDGGFALGVESNNDSDGTALYILTIVRI